MILISLFSYLLKATFVFIFSHLKSLCLKLIVVTFDKDLSIVSDLPKSSSLLKLRKSIAYLTFPYVHSFHKYRSGKIGENYLKSMTSH